MNYFPVNSSTDLTLRQFVLATGVLALVGLVSGCRTTFRTVDTRFIAQPGNQQRVQILPVWFEGARNVDRTLTTNDLQALSQQSGENLSSAVQETLLSKGYEIVGPVDIVSGGEMMTRLDPETRRLLEAVQFDFCEHLPRPCASANSEKPLTFRTNSTLGFNRYMSSPNWRRVKLEPNPFHCRMAPALTNLAVRLGATNAEAVLLVDTKAFFESPHNHNKRAAWNWTGGGLLTVTEVGVNLSVFAAAVLTGSGSAPVPIWVDPFWHSNNSLQHNIALVDVRTREVLWLNRQCFKHRDPRDAKVMKETVAGTLSDLPAVQPPAEIPP